MATRRRITCQFCGAGLGVLVNNARAINCPACQNLISLQPNPNGYGNHGGYNDMNAFAPPPRRPYNNMGGNPYNNMGGYNDDMNWMAPPQRSYGRGGMFSHNASFNGWTNNMDGNIAAGGPLGPGRKRAVLCGVSYYGHPRCLKGSVNNVKNMVGFLVEKMGFPADSVLILTEDEKDSRKIPTKRNMQTAMKWLVEGCKSGDSLVFYYTGHASQVIDRDGDEKDNMDEALCPVDFETEGKILDDEINETIVRPLPAGVKLHALVDTCRSGTALDLPFVCKMNGDRFYTWEDHRSHIFKGSKGGKAILLAACNDDQNSGDTTAFTGYQTGAMTQSFIQTVTSEPKITYGGLLSSLRIKVAETQKMMSNEVQKIQEPQLSSSETFDINLEPFLL